MNTFLACVQMNQVVCTSTKSIFFHYTYQFCKLIIELDFWTHLLSGLPFPTYQNRVPICGMIGLQDTVNSLKTYTDNVPH